jgi:hypothetical protein
MGRVMFLAPGLGSRLLLRVVAGRKHFDGARLLTGRRRRLLLFAHAKCLSGIDPNRRRPGSRKDGAANY